jgi:GxxExxY protein
MDADDDRLNSITEKIIGCAFTVCNVLGCGFAEKVYKNALAHEVLKCGLSVEKEKSINVMYDGIVVGEYFADLVVEGLVLVEVKSVRSLEGAHTAQCLNYLAATGVPICLLLNFGKRVEVKRFRNSQQPSASI